MADDDSDASADGAGFRSFFGDSDSDADSGEELWGEGVAELEAADPDAPPQSAPVDFPEGPVVVCQAFGRGIGWKLWPAARFLCDCLQGDGLQRHAGFAPSRVLELGAGTGLVGLYMARRGVPTTVTDLGEVLPVLQANVDANPDLAPLVRVEELAWGATDPAPLLAGEPAPLVLAADCVYWEQLFEPLADTLERCCAAGAVVLYAHTQRWRKREARFFARLAASPAVAGVEVLHEEVGPPLEEGARRSVQRLYRVWGPAGRPGVV